MRSTPRVLLLAALMLPSAWLGARAAEVASAQVSYVTASSVYVSAGSEDGLAVGQRLTVHRGAEVVATVEVTELSAHRAACRIVDRLLDPVVGDTVSFAPAAVPDAVVATSGETLPSRSAAPGAGIHGRIGMRYLSVFDRTDELGDYAQPALDVRLDSSSVAGSPWGFALDTRARRTRRSSADGLDEDDTRTRVYRAAAWWRDAAQPWSFTAGRQYAPALSAVSIFDGVSAQYARERYAVGMIAGTQPEIGDYGYATDVTEYGGYVEFRGAAQAPRRWSLTTGLIGSYEDSEVNREFLYVQGRLLSPSWTAYLTQEVDYNRSWKRDQGEDTIEPTSTFAGVSYRAGSRVTLNAGFDNRRNVRLYRDRETPETEFDDTFRRGIRAGVGLRAGRRMRFGLDGWSSSRDEAGDARSYTATGGARQLVDGHLDVHGRATRYENDRVEGWLYAAEVGAPLGRRVYLRAEGGVRQEDDLVGLSAGEDQSWFGLDADFALGRRWYLTLSAERTSGDRDEVDLLYSTVTYRF
jgi:hypothetical protein